MSVWPPEGLPAPYYADESVVIFNADCRDVLPLIAPGTIDLVLTDPPYGVGLTQKSWASEHEGKRASLAYDDQPDLIAALVREVMPMIISVGERSIVFPGPSLLWEYPPARTVGCVYVPSGAGRAPWGFQCSHPILYYGKDP